MPPDAAEQQAHQGQGEHCGDQAQRGIHPARDEVRYGIASVVEREDGTAVARMPEPVVQIQFLAGGEAGIAEVAAGNERGLV
jgi:D-aminopeptidase